MPTIKKIVNDFYSSDAYLKGSDLADVAQLAKADFRRLHPEAAEEIAEILAWCYTFDWK